MKVIQVPFCFFPDPVGGTEVYVDALARCLQKLDVQVLVAAPGQRDVAYAHNGLSVRRFAVGASAFDLRDLYGEGDAAAARAFGLILDEEQPQVVHLHAFTSAVSLRLAREAKRRGIPIVFTYHTPTVSCQRGTLMRWGQRVCDGELRLNTCTTCTMHGLGLPRGAADLVGHVPLAIGKRLGQIPLSGGIWTALRMRELMRLRHAAFRQFMSEIAHVVALCKWTQDLLVRNGVSPAKITLCRQGLAQEPEAGSQHSGATEGVARKGSLRIVFLGRLDPVKGLHILIQALQMAPDLLATLDVYGILQDQADTKYLKRLQIMSRRDPRVTFHPPIPSTEVTKRLRNYDLLATPSQWLETGPLVILEAFAAGLPVIGSRLGGIPELVEHEINGFLIEPNSAREWRRELLRFCREEQLLARLRQGVRPPRTMATVANEMFALYEKVL